MQTTINVELPRIINEGREYSVFYKGDRYRVSERLQGYQKTPSNALDEILGTKKDSFNLDTYIIDVEIFSNWMNFFLDMCRINPDLKRTCDEYMGWMKENYPQAQKMKKDAKEWANRNYDPKTLANKFEKTRKQFLPFMQGLRRIFYQFEKGLYEGSNIQFQKPNNPISD